MLNCKCNLIKKKLFKPIKNIQVSWSFLENMLHLYEIKTIKLRGNVGCLFFMLVLRPIAGHHL